MSYAPMDSHATNLCWLSEQIIEFSAKAPRTIFESADSLYRDHVLLARGVVHEPTCRVTAALPENFPES